jgi:hypothetical protein
MASLSAMNVITAVGHTVSRMSAKRVRGRLIWMADTFQG